MPKVKRIYVEKKTGFDITAKSACEDFQTILGKSSLKFVRILIRYDIEGISDEDFDVAAGTVFSEPAVDTLSFNTFEIGEADYRSQSNIYPVNTTSAQTAQRNAASC